jgi:O-antigen/teichoic acid export membrane protein
MVISGIKAQTAAAAINALLSFVLMMALARMLGTSRFADYSVLLNAGVLALMVLEGGYALLVYRETAAVSRLLLPWQAQLLPLSTAYALCMALWLGLLPVGTLLDQSNAAWYGVVACMLLVAWMNVYSGFLRGQGRFAQEALWQVMGRVASLLAIMVGMWAGWTTASGVFWAWALGLAVLLLLTGKPRWPPKPAFVWAGPIRHAAGHLMFGQLLYVAMLRVDLLMMATLGSTPVQMAYYAAAARFTELALLLFAPVMNVLPLGLRQRASDRARFGRFLRQVLATGLALAVVITTMGTYLAAWLMPLIFGPDFMGAAPLLGWQLGALVLVLPAQVLAQAVIAQNKERWVWAAYATGLPMALLALAWLVPGYGAMGAAWAMLLGHAGVLMMLALAAFRAGTIGTD